MHLLILLFIIIIMSNMKLVIMTSEDEIVFHLSGELLEDVATYSVQNGNGLSKVMSLS